MAESSADGLVRARLLESHIENATATSELFTKRGLTAFLKTIHVKVTRLSEEEMQFDLVGIDPVIANTLRRVLIAETPGMAIDHIFINQNTSIFQDEILAHRIALVPIKADANEFKFRTAGDLDGCEEDTIEFRLNVVCSNRSGRHKGRGGAKVKQEPASGSDQEPPERQSVLSKELKWIPRGRQRQKYPNGFAAAHDDIVIAKLVPGQEIDAMLHCVKGVGKDHAKFSPVGTAYYRFLPEIILKNSIEGELAERLQACFPKGVISVTEVKGRKIAQVDNVRKDNANGNVLLDVELRNMVELNKIKNYVLFTVESVGMMPAKDLVTTACHVVMDKCQTLLTALNDM